MPFTQHHFAQEIEALRGCLQMMGRMTATLVQDAVDALVRQDLALAGSVVERDAAVDALDRDIGARCLGLLACQQPVASDLRILGAILNAITDLERIADHAVDIARIADRLGDRDPYRPLVDFGHLEERARAMLRGALDAFDRGDLAAAATVAEADNSVDALCARMQDDLRDAMRHHPGCVVAGSYLLFVTHHLERVCDHCTNIAEHAVFTQTGRRVPKA